MNVFVMKNLKRTARFSSIAVATIASYAAFLIVWDANSFFTTNKAVLLTDTLLRIKSFMFVLVTNYVYAYILKAEHTSKATWIILCYELANAFQNLLYLFSALGMRAFAQMK